MLSSPQPAPTRMSRQRFILIGILFFHSVNTYMDRACIASAADFMMKDLSMSAEMLGLALGVFSVGYALFQVPSGWFADRFGARKALAIVVSFWSVFTALTGAAVNAAQLLVLRFLFGVGEAGAFPGAAQAFFRWLPAQERGLAHGINFSGSRLGAAFSLFFMPWLIFQIGWRWTFVVNGLLGLVWAAVWLLWFRDDPSQKPKVNALELAHILKGRAEQVKEQAKSSFAEIFTSLNMSLTMLQYFASNVTFFICLTWLPSYLKNQWSDDPKAIYWSALPLLFAAFANWVAGGMVTALASRGMPVASRRITAIAGFALGVIGLIMAMQTDNLIHFVVWFSVATFGVDMTLSPSWSFCNDIGGGSSGAVSGSMNMVGNIGAALSAILFPLFLNPVTGSANAFFVLAAGLNCIAVLCWLFMDPNRRSRHQASQRGIRIRFVVMLTGLLAITGAAVGTNIYFAWKKSQSKASVTSEVQGSDDQPAAE
jgi:MFS transporter, ACS family, glucarate transporter